MQKVCQQNIKVKSINVTEGQSWAVYGDGELGVAEGAFLSVPMAPLSLPSQTAQVQGLPCHRIPWGCKTPFSLKFSIPRLPEVSQLCLLTAGTAADCRGSARAARACCQGKAQSSGTVC